MRYSRDDLTQPRQIWLAILPLIVIISILPRSRFVTRYLSYPGIKPKLGHHMEDSLVCGSTAGDLMQAGLFGEARLCPISHTIINRR